MYAARPTLPPSSSSVMGATPGAVATSWCLDPYFSASAVHWDASEVARLSSGKVDMFLGGMERHRAPRLVGYIACISVMAPVGTGNAVFEYRAFPEY